MKIVIDIPEYDYRQIKECYEKNDTVEATYSYIYHGTPLQKGHEDLISRQAVKDLIRGLTRWCVRSQDRKFENVGLLYDDVMFGIDRLPSAEKTAEWIDLGNVIQCPNCETLYPKVRVDLKHYCERCGAKMKESD